MKFTILLTLALLVPFPAVLGQDVAPEEQPDPGVWEEILRLYEKARQTGEQVPKDVYEWLRQDVQSIGDWEYRVVEIKDQDPVRTESRLNELGAERWECIWIQTVGPKTRFVFKRPVRSYLTQIPLSRLMKLIPQE